MSLHAFLLAILGGTLAIGPAIYAAIEYFDLFIATEPKRKRVLVAVASAIVGVAVWGLAVALGYQPVPGAASGYAEAIWQYGVLSGFAAFMSATLIHGQRKLITA